MNRRTQWPAVAVATCVGLAAFAGCGSDESSGGEDGGTVKLGVILQLSGAAGVYGPPSQQAAELAAKEINDDGGVAGQELELVIADDGTDVKKAGEQAQKLLFQDEVAGVISTNSSAQRDAILPVVRRANSVYIYTPLYEGKACDERLFNIGETPQQQVSPVVPYMHDRFDANKWFFLGNDYVWPQKLSESTQAAVEESGGTVVGEEFVPLGTTDFSSVIQKVKGSGADFVMMALVGSDAIAYVKQAASSGLNDSVKTVGLAMLDNTLPAVGASGQGLISPYGYFDLLDTPANEQFHQDLESMFGDKTAQQTTLSESTYDAIHMWAAAANKADSTEPDDVIAAMDGVSVDTPRGTLTMDGSNRHVSQGVYIGEAQADGTFEILEDLGVTEPGDQCSL